MALEAVGRDADDAFERVADRIVGGRADLVADEAVDDDVGGALELDRTALRRARAGDEDFVAAVDGRRRSEEHTSELQSLMRISYAVFCLKKKHNTTQPTGYSHTDTPQ